MSRRKRSRLIDSWREPDAPPIDMPLTLASFRALLSDGASPHAIYTHQQIKNWCARFWWRHTEESWYLGLDVPHEVKRAVDIARDVEAQWDTFLYNTYTFPELKRLDISQIRLPAEWFVDWLARLDQIAPPDHPE